ncbi:MAG: YlbF family regulator [Clostridia bacterium]|nr:YlbF family regulator [Clostridia bacterium]
MDVMTAVRQLGAAIQEDEAYARFHQVIKENDENKELQEKIGEFNILRMNLDNELSLEEKNEEKIKEMNEKLRALYGEVMAHPAMVAYNEAKQGLDKLLNDVNNIITMCVQGADPATCEPSACTGSCSTCGGCH